MGRRTFSGGGTVVRLGGKWPKTHEVGPLFGRRFASDSIQESGKNLADSGNMILRKRGLGADHYLSLVVWAVLKNRPIPSVPRYYARSFAKAVAATGGGLAWARSQPRFEISCTAIRKRIVK